MLLNLWSSVSAPNSESYRDLYYTWSKTPTAQGATWKPRCSPQLLKPFQIFCFFMCICLRECRTLSACGGLKKVLGPLSWVTGSCELPVWLLGTEFGMIWKGSKSSSSVSPACLSFFVSSLSFETRPLLSTLALNSGSSSLSPLGSWASFKMTLCPFV